MTQPTWPGRELPAAGRPDTWDAGFRPGSATRDSGDAGPVWPAPLAPAV